MFLTMFHPHVPETSPEPGMPGPPRPAGRPLRPPCPPRRSRPPAPPAPGLLPGTGAAAAPGPEGLRERPGRPGARTAPPRNTKEGRGDRNPTPLVPPEGPGPADRGGLDGGECASPGRSGAAGLRARDPGPQPGLHLPRVPAGRPAPWPAVPTRCIRGAGGMQGAPAPGERARRL